VCETLFRVYSSAPFLTLLLLVVAAIIHTQLTIHRKEKAREEKKDYETDDDAEDVVLLGVRAERGNHDVSSESDMDENDLGWNDEGWHENEYDGEGGMELTSIKPKLGRWLTLDPIAVLNRQASEDGDDSFHESKGL
jgi:hypothetical protein